MISTMLPHEGKVVPCERSQPNQLTLVLREGEQLKAFCGGQQLAAGHRSSCSKYGGFQDTDDPHPEPPLSGVRSVSQLVRKSMSRIPEPCYDLGHAHRLCSRIDRRPNPRVATRRAEASGKNAVRLQLDACLKSLRDGDTLVVWRLDRLGRNLADLVGLVTALEQRKINFESLTEKIETVSPSGRLVFHVFAALAEFERNLIRERTMAGLTAARARGRTGGRPPKLTSKEIKTIRALLKSAEIPVAEIAARFHIARSTLYRVILKPAV